ncbi:parafibromin-like [Colossoma macropomum]|uniref:parafibromin-like n=1 Tax=Colossoma macropomum TaxID=42526 RepID=UPI001864BAB2|nr:parafibromin-like [Colossoma macropomum]
MVKALKELRRFHLEKKAVVVNKTQVVLGNLSWPKDTKTKFAVSGCDERYTLESVVFLLQNANLQHDHYLRRAAIQKIPAVKQADRRNILAYLNGEPAKMKGSSTLTVGHTKTRPVKRRADEDSPADAKRPRREDVRGVCDGDRSSRCVRRETLSRR